MLSSGLVVVHDAVLGGQDAEPILSGRQDLVHFSVHVCELQIEARRDSTTLVDAARQLDDDFVCSLVVDDLNVINISTRLGLVETTGRRKETYPCFHHFEEPDDDGGHWSQENLSLASSFSVDDFGQTV